MPGLPGLDLVDQVCKLTHTTMLKVAACLLLSTPRMLEVKLA